MSTGLSVALVSAAVALISIVLNFWLQSRQTTLQGQLNAQQEQRQEEASSKARLEQVVSRYRDPLLYAAHELQSRIWNLLERDMISMLKTDREESCYVVDSTLFVIAQYLAWVEAIRRGVQYLDLGNEDRSRELVGLLEEIRHSFSTRHKFAEPFFQIFRSEQRAIGELMLQGRLDRRSGSMLWRCRGYAYFCAMLERDDTFRSWFSRLKGDVRGLAENKERARARLVALQNALIDLIDSLDVPRGRIPEESRRKIT